MVEASDTNRHWVLLGQQFNQKRTQGLSEYEAEQEIRRERVQNLIPCRCRDQHGNVVDPPPDWFWPLASFDFKTSWVTAPLPPDPLAPEMARIGRQVERNRRAVQRMLGLPATDIEDTATPPRPRVLRYFVEVLIEAQLAKGPAAAIPEPVDSAEPSAAELELTHPEVDAAPALQADDKSRKSRFRGDVFKPYLLQRYGAEDKIPDDVDAPAAYQKIANDMADNFRSQGKTNKEIDKAIPGYPTFARFVGRWKPRRS
jgi:hypothetical protein